VTQQIADALEIEREKAQELKHSHGFIYSSESTIPKEHEPFFKAIRDGYSPIKRFIDISLMAAQNQSKTSIERIYISGGGAKIKGLYDYLESQLGMPFEPLIPSSLPFKGISSLAQDGESTMKAIGLSTQSIGVNRSFCLNFRKGDFAYAGEFKYVREKAWYFVLIGIFLLSLGIAKAIVRYTVLERQQGEYFQSLKDVSKDLFGKEETDFDRVLTLVSKKPSVQELEIIPQYSAFRILYDISQTLNTVNQMTLSPGTGEILPEGVEQPGEKDKTKDKAKEKLFTPSPDVNPGAKDPGTGERNPESENVPEEPAEEELKLQVEFDQIIINDAQVTLIGHANDVKAYNELSRKLQEHPCFKEKDAIKTESRGKVKFTRHRDWFQFAIMIQYKCPTRIIEKESQKKKSE
jgi:cell division ATPase FtsA